MSFKTGKFVILEENIWLKQSFLPSSKDLKVIILNVGERVLKQVLSYAFNERVS